MDRRVRVQHLAREQRLRLIDREGSVRFSSVLETEPFNAARGVQQLLLPRKERVAIGADVQMQFRNGGAGLPAIAAGTMNSRRCVFGMNFRLHFCLWSSEWRTG